MASILPQKQPRDTQQLICHPGLKLARFGWWLPWGGCPRRGGNSRSRAKALCNSAKSTCSPPEKHTPFKTLGQALLRGDTGPQLLGTPTFVTAAKVTVLGPHYLTPWWSQSPLAPALRAPGLQGQATSRCSSKKFTPAMRPIHLWERVRCGWCRREGQQGHWHTAPGSLQAAAAAAFEHFSSNSMKMRCSSE